MIDPKSSQQACSDTVKVGVDICSTRRIEEAYKRFGDRFLEKVLTEDEKIYVSSSKRHLVSRLAARFAAKEAIAKALGLGLRGLSFKEMEIKRSHTGEPGVTLHARAKKRASDLGLNNFQISLSHERDYAVAFVVAYGKNQI